MEDSVELIFVHFVSEIARNGHNQKRVSNLFIVIYLCS